MEEILHQLVGSLIPQKGSHFMTPEANSVSQTEFWRPVPKSPSHAKAMATGPVDEKKGWQKSVRYPYGCIQK